MREEEREGMTMRAGRYDVGTIGDESEGELRARRGRIDEAAHATGMF